MLITPTFIIAEAGVNHNGSEALALGLVDAAKQCGADAVKFQTFSADQLVRPGAEKAQYQKNATGEGDQHSMLRQLEMSAQLHRKLFARCAEQSIEFMSTPFDESAADFLIELGMRRIKVPSGEITNHPFLRFLARKNKPLILSTGMATLDEIVQAVGVVQHTRAQLGLTEPLASMLTVLHCTSNYPAQAHDVHLRAMHTIGQKLQLPVGYSDHTLGVAVATAAVALGARVIEKHFTLDKTLPGPDHPASLSVQELAQMVAQIRCVEQALGQPEKNPTASELPVRALVRRSVTTRRALTAGSTVSADDVCLLRPGTGIEPAALEAIYGRKLKTSLEVGSTVHWSDLV
jgi:N,N'-diacetyllegionaminate synthase